MTDIENSLNVQNENGKRLMKMKLLVSSVVLYIIAVGFSTMFNLGSFDKLYIESNVSQYLVIGRDLQRKLESGIRYGKSLERFIGIEKHLSQAKSDILSQLSRRQKTQTGETSTLKDKDITVSIATPDGSILYSDNTYLLNQRLPEEAMDLQSKSTESKKPKKCEI